ncbi:hypothetical protein Hdeb2414_s0171g00822201 [Helianthus debilis subsp. tardiflorus]
MVKTKKPAGKTIKRNAVASSSSSPKQQRAGRQKELVVHNSENEPIPEPLSVHPAQLRREQMEREAQAQRQPPRLRPDWKGGFLDDIEYKWQAELFDWKMSKNSDRKDGFMCEKEISIEDFKPFGLVQKFEALGWEAALKCYDGETGKVCMDAIQEWVGRLEMDPGTKPPETMKLTGWVGEVKVIMSFETLNEIAKFDSKEGRYTFPKEVELYHPEKNKKWDTMLKDVFEPGKGKEKKMKKEELKLPLRLLLTFVQQNVMPRRSDRAGIRDSDIPILHCLMKGKPKISYRYLVMMNIWTSRNYREKQLIPHYRLITALLKKYGAITGTSKFFMLPKGHAPFILEKLGPYGWEYVKTDRYHKLKNVGRKWRGLRPDARMLLAGEEDEANSGESVMGESDGEDAEEVAMGANVGTSSGMHDVEDVSEFVERERHEDWSSWPDFAQVLYDKLTRLGEQQKRDRDRNELWHRVHAYNEQKEINDRYLDDKRRRLNGDASVGEPPLHHSAWLDPEQDAPPEGYLDMMKGVFGDPKPPHH